MKYLQCLNSIICKQETSSYYETDEKLKWDKMNVFINNIAHNTEVNKRNFDRSSNLKYQSLIWIIVSGVRCRLLTVHQMQHKSNPLWLLLTNTSNMLSNFWTNL